MLFLLALILIPLVGALVFFPLFLAIQDPAAVAAWRRRRRARSAVLAARPQDSRGPASRMT